MVELQLKPQPLRYTERNAMSWIRGQQEAPSSH